MERAQLAGSHQRRARLVPVELTRNIRWVIMECIQNFSVEWGDVMRPTATTGRVTVDGLPCGGRIIRLPDYPNDSASRTCMSTVMTSPTTARPFCFSPVEVTGIAGQY